MAWWRPRWWWRLRAWVARRLGLWRGVWHRAELELPLARWGFFTWPWSRARWEYAVYVPGGLPAGAAAPLLVLLHGCRQEAVGFAQASGWVAAADRGRFRLLCPEQPARANPFRCWNWFAPAAQAGEGEQQVVLQALQATTARWPCTQVAAVGLSAGGGLAALLALHHGERFAAVVAVAAPPLLGRMSLQDPRQVMRQGLAGTATQASDSLVHCAPLLVLHGADDDVVAPRCAEQLTAQAQQVLAREFADLAETTLADGTEWSTQGRVLLRRRLLPGLGHAWSGAPGGHAHVQRAGPPLTTLALEFVQAAAPDFRAR